MNVIICLQKADINTLKVGNNIMIRTPMGLEISMTQEAVHELHTDTVTAFGPQADPETPKTELETVLKRFLEYIGKEGLYIETDGSAWKDAFTGPSSKLLSTRTDVIEPFLLTLKPRAEE